MYKFVRILNSKKGSSLLVVIVVFAVVMILGTALLSVVSYSHDNAIQNHRQQQAYYTARSAMDTILNNLGDTGTCAALSAKLQASGGVDLTATGSVPNMGDYTAVFNHNATTKRVKIVVKSKYQGAEYRIAATLKPGKGSRFNPIDFVFFNKGAGIDGISASGVVDDADKVTIEGNVYTNVACVPVNTQIKGNYMTFGSFDITDSRVQIDGDLHVNGGVTVTAPQISGKIVKGKIITTKTFNPLNLDDAITIANCNSYKDGLTAQTLELPSLLTDIGFMSNTQYREKNWNISYITSAASTFTVAGGAKVTPSTELVELENGSSVQFSTENKFYPASGPVVIMAGDQDCGFGIKANTISKKVTLANGNIIDFVNRTFTIKTGSTPSEEKKAIYNMDSDQVEWFEGGTRIDTKALGQLYVWGDGRVVEKSNLAIVGSNSGTISINRHTNLTATSFSGADIVVDTTAKDIMLVVNDTVSLSNSKISIKGDNKVYLFFPDDKEFNVGDNCILGQKGSQSTNQLFIIGNKLKMTLGGNSVLKGTAYLHDGSYSEGVSPATGITKVEGCVVAKDIKITRRNTYKYVEPNEDPAFDTNLPSNYYIYPRLNPNEIDWKLDYYGD